MSSPLVYDSLKFIFSFLLVRNRYTLTAIFYIFDDFFMLQVNLLLLLHTQDLSAVPLAPPTSKEKHNEKKCCDDDGG